MKGMFITFEGIEGCGKTTQIDRFADYIRRQGTEVLTTREPGGTAIGDQIRRILLAPGNTALAPVAEALLYAAARAQHVEEKIAPAMKRCMVVISDRYADATSAYQGAARKLPGNKLQELHKIATGGLKPDMTFLLDLPAATGLERARKRNKAAGCEDRFENENIGFHEKVRRGYLDIARDEPERVAVIDAAGTEDAVFNRIVTEFERRRERLCGGK